MLRMLLLRYPIFEIGWVSVNFKDDFDLKALGVMSPLLSDERVYKDTTQVVTTMITYYKKGGKDYYEVKKYFTAKSSNFLNFRSHRSLLYNSVYCKFAYRNE